MMCALTVKTCCAIGVAGGAGGVPGAGSVTGLGGVPGAGAGGLSAAPYKVFMSA